MEIGPSVLHPKLQEKKQDSLFQEYYISGVVQPYQRLSFILQKKRQ